MNFNLKAAFPLVSAFLLGVAANMYDMVSVKFTDKELEAKVNSTSLQRSDNS